MVVYSVFIRCFFNQNSTDYAMAVDFDKDLELFVNYSDALNKYKSTVEFYKKNFADHFDESNKNTVILYNKYENVRYIITLSSKIVK